MKTTMDIAQVDLVKLQEMRSCVWTRFASSSCMRLRVRISLANPPREATLYLGSHDRLPLAKDGSHSPRHLRPCQADGGGWNPSSMALESGAGHAVHFLGFSRAGLQAELPASTYGSSSHIVHSQLPQLCSSSTTHTIEESNAENDPCPPSFLRLASRCSATHQHHSRHRGVEEARWSTTSLPYSNFLGSGLIGFIQCPSDVGILQRSNLWR
jgi:hypothetical protein